MAQSHIDDLLTCAICLDRFEQPKQLPCQHTFCLAPCLEALVENCSVRCPECRTVHRLPQNGARGFPNNLTIVKLLDVPAQAKLSDETSCQECKKENCLFGKCLHCDQILCRECLSKHTKTLNTELNQLVAKVENRRPKILNQIAEITESQKRVNQNKQSTVSEIEQWYDQCVSALRAKKKKFVDETTALWNNETRMLEEKQEALEMELAVISSFCENANMQTKRASSDVETTHAQKSLIEMMKETKIQMEKQLGEDTTEKYTKFSTEEAESIVNSISKFRGVATFVRPTAPRMTECGESNSQKATVPSKESSIRGATRGLASIQTSTPVIQPGVASNEQNASQRATTLQMYRNKGTVKTIFKGTKRLFGNDGRLNSPWGITLTVDENIVVTDRSNDRIQIFDTSGKSVSTFGRCGQGDGEFKSPCGVCVTSSGQIIVADTYNHRIQVFDMAGMFISTFGEGKLSRPDSVASNSDGLFYVSDNSNRISVFSLNGNFIRSFGESWLDSSGLIKFITCTHDNRVVVAESAKNRIGIFDSGGRLLRQIGEEEDNGAGQFDGPRGVACDQYENIIVADCWNHRIQIFDSDGNFISSFGSKGSEPSQMDHPTGVAVLRNGDIVVSDSDNNRIQIF